MRVIGYVQYELKCASEHGMCEYGDVQVIGYVRVVRS